MRSTTLTLALTLTVACDPGGDGPTDDSADAVVLPLGLPTTAAGETWAGASVVDITPTITETFTDVDGDFHFDGCLDDPDASGDGCDEPFDDADDDGTFDAVFIGGFDVLRPALEVRDPITARAFVVADGGSYVAVVSLDLVGLAHPRIEAAANALLEEEGFDPDALIVHSTHNHQGPDTMGLWGNPEPCLVPGNPDCASGFDPAYQDQVAAGIAQAVKDAAAAAVPVSLTVGQQHMRDASPYLNGKVFGGVNPTDKMHGMVHDIRDPVLVSDLLLALQAKDADDATVFTWTIWSGHPEVRGSDNNALSADFVGFLRDEVERVHGGIAIHSPESLGGMQSALGGNLPLIDEAGERVFKTCTADDVTNATEGCDGKTAGDPALYGGDHDGLAVPVWADRNTWDFTRSHGLLLAEATTAVLADGTTFQADNLKVMAEDGWTPVRNLAYDILGPAGIFDLGIEDATMDPAECPEAPETNLGCVPYRVFRLRMGPMEIGTAPGEILPEVSWGLPEDDPTWELESADATARGAGATYFPQQDADCATVDFAADCKESFAEGACDCLSMHAVPYRVTDDPELAPVLAKVDAEYRAVLSMTSTYLSYMVPEPDVNPGVSLLTDDGDHYEDSVTIGYDFTETYLRAWNRLDARWNAE